MASTESPPPGGKPNPWGQPQTSGTSPRGWGVVNTPAPCSLEDVMSEELARELQTEEDQTKPKSGAWQSPATETNDDVDLSQFMDAKEDMESDLLLAQMLQHQFDREHDVQLHKEEQKYNGPSKVTLSFSNYRAVHPALGEDEDDEDDEEEAWEMEKEKDTVPTFKKGISGKGKNIITKHDPMLSARKNAKNFMEKFPADFETGDSSKFDMRLSNKVYNQLKLQAQTSDKRKLRLHEKKEHSTAEMAVDERTRLILYRLMNSGTLEAVNGIFSTGKESVIIHASGGQMNEELVPTECALKVFKTTLSDFKNRAQYVKGDGRFFKDEFKKQNPRRIMKIWALKEEVNLKRLERAGIPCPKVVLLRKHVLVMEFIGKDTQPAPKLRDARLNTVDMQMAYEQCIEYVKKMYREAGLVHADLSEYNMLWHNDMLYFIDVSQAVERMHPRAMEFLLRDCMNICSFFDKSGIPNVPTPYQLFNDITGLDLKGEGEDFLVQIEDYEKDEDKLKLGTGKNYPFEYFFNKSVQDRELDKAAKRLGEEEEDDSDEESSEEEDEEEENRGDDLASVREATKLSSAEEDRSRQTGLQPPDIDSSAT